ncbi:MAG TPA: cadherin-like domain-containing protein, partial [Thermoanaerobaculia bacterium]|nr:cadherin-like domain-containing protein [Thermoanaerobaculia bacterium]
MPTFAFASVTVSGTTSFASLDGGPDDADHTVNGVFTVNGDLIVNGTINCNDDTGVGACPMQFVVSGNLTLNAGSQIFAENRSTSGNGGNITFTVGGNAVIQGTSGTLAGALVSSSKLNTGTTFHAGDVTINAAGTVTQGSGSIIAACANDSQGGAISITGGGEVIVNGDVLSGPTRSLSTSTLYNGIIMSGGGGHVVGGPITVQSTTHDEPAVVIGGTAIIANQGGDVGTVNGVATGGYPVTIQGCNVQINGLVASLARRNPGPRVVVRSGTSLTVDASSIGTAGGAHYGVLRADATREDATVYHVDLYAAKDITINGAPATSGLYAVTSNPGSTTARTAGTINVISTGATVTASGNAFQTSGTQGGDSGGNVNVSAMGNVTLGGANIDASGATSGSTRSGGNINVRSYSGALSWTAGIGDVRPVGSTAGVPAAQQGTITLTYCTTLSTSGTSFPTNGSAVGVFPTTAQTCSPAAPSLPAGETLPVCNRPPVANNGSATTNEDNSVTVTMTATDPDGDPITFTIVTPPAHGSLSAIFNPTPTSAQVTYSPNADYNGSDSFTFQADDGKGGTSIGTVTITINPVNDPPTFNLGANPVSSNEDAGPQSIANYASSISPGPTADEQTQTVTFTVTNDNNALFSVQPAISPSGTLTYTSAPNANGSANVMVVAQDNGGTANGGNDTSTTHNFNIIINAVNDAPSFTKGADQTVLEDSGAHSVSGWATGISAGPADESSQTVTFNVTNNNNALFSAQPAVASDGTLTYTSAPNANGTATVSVAA